MVAYSSTSKGPFVVLLVRGATITISSVSLVGKWWRDLYVSTKRVDYVALSLCVEWARPSVWLASF